MEAEDDLRTAETLRLGVSRLASRLRARHPGRGQALTRMSASVLANLRHDGPLTPTALAAIEGLQPQSLTRVLNELEERGRIVRSTNRNDRRSQDIAITDLGIEALDGHVQEGNRWLASALTTLTPTERGVLELAAGLMVRLAETAPGTSGRHGGSEEDRGTSRQERDGS
ncbi:MarR family transcriptional regulator [Streptomyces sp. Go-475]|uniref:MarR family winged helix-turn-helix transcriptional regulator n=1 Tax=Streptomyces sp. Go-475 TaxID=2072505 RepID=UPI000DF04841|nr:MarR family transcriptional regulator [Streptomyces sp. Go-475]AXE89949.1 transcriptional repressor MprA [Streptomyces sp. Go-475]